MFKRILILSDNLEMLSFFSDYLKETFVSKEIHVTYSVSPQSDHEHFSKKIGQEVKVINLKDESVVDTLTKNFDLVISVHCKQIFPKILVNSCRCINIHPGYNPINRGWYPQVFSIIHDLPIGATIHEIDEDLDHGNIIAREFEVKTSYDTSLSLYNKILQKEKELIRKHMTSIINDTYESFVPEGEGNMFLKKDFNNLCEIDLNKVQAVGVTINYLRALSHGEYANAFYWDEATKEKVYVKIELRPGLK
jgi:methionyl-tRNA formyltransferase